MVVRVVYVVTGALAIWSAGQEAARLAPDDAFVFYPRALRDSLDDRVELRCLAEHAEIVIATACTPAASFG
jgi:hypothetical protein